jgi:hypothetical protein
MIGWSGVAAGGRNCAEVTHLQVPNLTLSAASRFPRLSPELNQQIPGLYSCRLGGARIRVTEVTERIPSGGYDVGRRGGIGLPMRLDRTEAHDTTNGAGRGTQVTSL